MGLALSSLYWCVIPETPSKDGETNGLRSHIDGDEWLPMASTPSWWQKAASKFSSSEARTSRSTTSISKDFATSSSVERVMPGKIFE